LVAAADDADTSDMYKAEIGNVMAWATEHHGVNPDGQRLTLASPSAQHRTAEKNPARLEYPSIRLKLLDKTAKCTTARWRDFSSAKIS